MRYRLMATYLGVPYHAGLGPDGNEATLFSPAPPPEELGFTAAGGHWRKQVLIADLDALWQSRLVGDYRGEPCLVLDDLGDRLHIAYLGRDSVRARQLGYWEIDREVFEVVVARQDITGLTEERVEYPLSSAMFPPSNIAQARPATPGRGMAAGQGPGGPPPGAGERSSERTGPLRVVPRPAPRPPAEPAGYPEPGGYPGKDRSSSTPDRVAAWHGSPESEPWSEPSADPRPGSRPEPRSGPQSRPELRAESRPELRADPRSERRADAWPESRMDPRPEPRAGAQAGDRSEPWSGRRAGRRDRVPQSVFAELLSLAAIPHAAYAVDEEVPGAMCLVKADGGFEVFSRTDDARLDVRFFEDEEAAYFYLFGVLAAEAVRSGRLRPAAPNGHLNGSRGPTVPGSPSSPTENVSKYLRRKKLPKSASHPVIVN
jgi:hypothetical protein